MVDVYEISAVVAAVGVLIGVVYYILDMRHQRQVRQTDIIMTLYGTFQSKEFQAEIAKIIASEFRDYDDAVKRYGWDFGFPVGLFFEGVGVLLHRRLVDISLVDDLFTFQTKIMWEKLKPVTEGARRHFNAPTIFEYFEYLYNEMQKREQKLAKG